MRLRTPVRSADAELVDAFFVSAVATLLLIRIFLEATGYPRLGGGGLHVAHVLWGGLGMVVAIVLLLVFVSPATRLVAAIVGGAGFGAFIDELGKFLTSDNDYFFKPTAALVYALFVVLFLVVRQVRLFRALNPEESLVNAVELAEQLAMRSLDEEERARALALLARADQSDPLVAALRERFLAARIDVESSPLRRLAVAASHRYAAIAGHRWFRRVIAGIFILQAIGFVLTIVAGGATVVGQLLGVPEAGTVLEEASGGDTLTSWIQLASGIVGGALTLYGVVALRRSRPRAYRAFELAILVDLLLYIPFTFLDEGFVASFDVFIDLALLATLRYLQAQERLLAAGTAPVAGMAAPRAALVRSH